MRRPFSWSIPAVILLLSGSLQTVLAQTAPPLGTTQQFAVLGASTVTNTGATILTGDLGVSPGTAITGFPPGLLTGTIHAADAVAAQAQLDALEAYDALAGQACTTNLSGTDLGGLTLLPGVYCFDTSAQLTGTLTLDATGSPNPVFVFKIGSTLTTAPNSAVVVTAGSACNVYFQVGSSATLGTGTQLLGRIFAQASITVTTGATVTGGTYALNGEVTLDGNGVTACVGSLQVCKLAGSGVATGANFDFSISGNPAIGITVPAGPSPSGYCGPTVTVPAQPTTITETIPAGTTLAAVSTLPDPGSLISSNLGAGTATVEINPGGQTIATFLNTVPPAVPTTGFLQICKIAGSGVALGTPFTFTVAGTPVVVAAGPAPGGTCSAALVVPGGQTLIAEILPAGTLLTEVATFPDAGLLVSSNLAAGQATVTVNAGGQTIATFTNSVPPVVPTTGTLQVCKVAGSGVGLGTNFAFSAAGSAFTVATGTGPGGNCGPVLTVPLGSVIITETLPAGTVLTSVTTSPSAGLLVSSNLAAGTATVTVNAGVQTTATFTNTVPVIPTTGLLQICKVAGSGVAPGTNFSFRVAGTPLVVPAGAGPLGTCCPAVVVPLGPAIITETLPAGTVLTSITTLPNAGLLVSSNLAAGTATVTVNAGGVTTATFTNTGPTGPNTDPPVVPTVGTLQVCKIAGSGVAPGTPFTFNIAGTPAVVAAGACSPVVTVSSGSTTITEILPTGTVLTSVSTLPSGLLVSSNLGAGTATVSVAAGRHTIANFTNTIPPVIPATGFLQVCKIAGSGLAAGTPFTFNVAGTPVVVLAGAAPGGTCSTPQVVPAGTAVITETLPPGTALSAVSTLPSAALLISSNPGAGTATVTVTPGGQTIATFTNTAPIVSPTTGLLQVCKIGGSGVTAGTNFTFNVAGNPVVVPAGAAPGGSCSVAVAVAAGQAQITETLPAGTTLTSVTALPAGSLVSSNLAAGTAIVTVVAGAQTTVTFLNTVPPVIPTTGLVQVCKVAGAGIAVGTNFTFNVGGTPVTVPAGAAPGGSCSTPLVVPVGTTAITENTVAGTLLTSVSTLPVGSLVSSDLAARTATVTVTAGGQTIATFLNTIIPAAPTGFLQICKVAGSGVTAGTNFSFSVAGNTITVPAGPGPGGSCSQSLQLPVGQVVVTEAALAGVTLAGISASPSGRLVTSNLANRTAVLNIVAGDITTQTVLTVTNQAANGQLSICKVAGPGVTAGAQFSFSVGGNTVLVAAGSCVAAGTFPVGTQVTATETIPAGHIVNAIAVSPSAQIVGAPNLANGSVVVTIGSGTTQVTFTNEQPVQTGQLRICKIAGTGVAPGGNFTFVVAGASLTVQAGSCVTAPASFPVGTILTVAETASLGAVVSAIGVSPVARQGVVNLTAGTVVVTIGTGVTEVSFTNTASGFGLLKVCKIAGTGVVPLTNFTFVAAGATFTVPAGYCVNRGLLLVGTVVTVTELFSAGTVATAISVLPASRQGIVDLPGRTVTATIGEGVTEVLFTNVRP